MLQIFTYSTGLSACAASACCIQLGARPRNRKLHARRCSQRTVRCDAMTVPPQRQSTSRSRRPWPGDRRPSDLSVSLSRTCETIPRALRSLRARKTPARHARFGARPLALPPENFRATRPPRAAPNARRESPDHRFARVRSRIRSRARFRDAFVKKIFNSPESSLCDSSRVHRGEKISRRARAPALAPRIATAQKPLCHADFCVTRRNAPLLSSLRSEKSCAR